MVHAFQQPHVVFALVQMPESPSRKVPGPIGTHREVPRPHVKKVHRIVAAIGNATPKRSGRLDYHQAKRPFDVPQTGNRGGGTGEAPTDHANIDFMLHQSGPPCGDCRYARSQAGCEGIAAESNIAPAMAARRKANAATRLVARFARRRTRNSIVSAATLSPK